MANTLSSILSIPFWEIPGKTVHNQLLHVMQHKFQRFQNLYCLFASTREATSYVISTEKIIMLLHFYKRGDLAITPSGRVILLGYFYKRCSFHYLRSLHRGSTFIAILTSEALTFLVYYLYQVRLCGSILVDSLLLRYYIFLI